MKLSYLLRLRLAGGFRQRDVDVTVAVTHLGAHAAVEPRHPGSALHPLRRLRIGPQQQRLVTPLGNRHRQLGSARESDGMAQGLLTGKRLSDFDTSESLSKAATGYRYAASRAIINGDVRQNGPKIEAYGRAFETALREAGYGPSGQERAGSTGPGVVVVLRPGKSGSGGKGQGESATFRSICKTFERLAAAIVAIIARWAK